MNTTEMYGALQGSPALWLLFLLMLWSCQKSLRMKNYSIYSVYTKDGKNICYNRYELIKGR